MGFLLDRIPSRINFAGIAFSNFTAIFSVQLVICVLLTPFAFYLLKDLSDKHEDYA
jgi:hypothetical protein